MSTDANETSEQPFVTDAVMKDLRELVRSYSGPLPGATGRAGTKLVRLGLARNLGRVVTDASLVEFLSNTCHQFARSKRSDRCHRSYHQNHADDGPQIPFSAIP